MRRTHTKPLALWRKPISEPFSPRPYLCGLHPGNEAVLLLLSAFFKTSETDHTVQHVAYECGISVLTSRECPVSGITGVGLAVPGATPGTGVSGVPDGSAVVVQSGTGNA